MSVCLSSRSKYETNISWHKKFYSRPTIIKNKTITLRYLCERSFVKMSEIQKIVEDLTMPDIQGTDRSYHLLWMEVFPRAVKKKFLPIHYCCIEKSELKHIRKCYILHNSSCQR